MNIVPNSSIDSIARNGASRPGAENTEIHHPPAPLPVATTPRCPPQEYLVTTHRNGRITQRRMAAEQVQALDPAEVDFFWDTVFGVISIQPPNGPRRQHFGSIPGLGQDVGLPLLQHLMFSPGRLVSERELRQLPGLANVAGNALSARLSSIRRAFGDSNEKAWLLITTKSPFRVAWNKLRSFRFVENLARTEGQ